MHFNRPLWYFTENFSLILITRCPYSTILLQQRPKSHLIIILVGLCTIIGYRINIGDALSENDSTYLDSKPSPQVTL